MKIDLFGQWPIEAYNQQGYSNPEVDALLEKGRTTADEAVRKDIYKQIETIRD